MRRTEGRSERKLLFVSCCVVLSLPQDTIYTPSLVKSKITTGRLLNSDLPAVVPSVDQRGRASNVVACEGITYALAVAQHRTRRISHLEALVAPSTLASQLTSMSASNGVDLMAAVQAVIALMNMSQRQQDMGPVERAVRARIAATRRAHASQLSNVPG